MYWRCRRGTRELDLILSQFLDDGFDALNPKQKQLFSRLVDQSNALLQQWLCYAQRPNNKEMEDLVQTIRLANSSYD